MPHFGSVSTSPAAQTFQLSPKHESIPANTYGSAEGTRICRTIRAGESPYTRAISSRRTSLLHAPLYTASVITGTHMINAANTGTADEPNQKRAARIKDTTGVQRISASGNCINVWMRGCSALKSPTIKPAHTANTNAHTLRSAVEPTCSQNERSRTNTASARHVSSGDGSTSGEPAAAAAACHTASSTAHEKTLAASVPENERRGITKKTAAVS